MEAELKLGGKINFLTKDELSDALREAQAIESARIAGIKQIRLPMLRGTAASSAIALGGDNVHGSTASPEQGYVWTVRHLVIEGMTASSSAPDVMNIYRGGTSADPGRLIWQLNGNSFSQTWGRGEITLWAGETLLYKSVGTFASTSQIIIHGMADQVPAEMIGKLP